MFPAVLQVVVGRVLLQHRNGRVLRPLTVFTSFWLELKISRIGHVTVRSPVLTELSPPGVAKVIFSEIGESIPNRDPALSQGITSP